MQQFFSHLKTTSVMCLSLQTQLAASSQEPQQTEHSHIESITKTQSFGNPSTHNTDFLKRKKAGYSWKKQSDCKPKQHRPKTIACRVSVFSSVLPCLPRRHKCQASVLITKEISKRTSQPVSTHSHPLQKKVKEKKNNIFSFFFLTS